MRSAISETIKANAFSIFLKSQNSSQIALGILDKTTAKGWYRQLSLITEQDSYRLGVESFASGVPYYPITSIHFSLTQLKMSEFFLLFKYLILFNSATEI